ncbi:MAG: arsenate reductase (glutaredoxin) [Campylobacterales bacterium]|nr:arsenate reductase (glutaredoxin) [Campylobacterales bacterium]
MSKVTIWHNPKCSKSRQALEIVEQNGCEKEVVKYLEATPSKDQLKNVLKMLGISPRELMRTKEDLYKELDLKNETNDEKLIDAMVQNPKLIERPIIIKGNKAVIARPPEKALELL